MKFLFLTIILLISNVYSIEQQEKQKQESNEILRKSKLSCIDDLCSLSITQDNGDDEILMAKLISCKDQCLVSANGKLYLCENIKNKQNVNCEKKSFSLSDILLKIDEDFLNDDDNNDSNEEFLPFKQLKTKRNFDNNEDLRKLFHQLNPLQYGKRFFNDRLPYDTLGYGKRSVSRFDKKMYHSRLPFDTLGYGKRIYNERLPFDTLGYGKRIYNERLPFDTLGYGKRFLNNLPFEGYILGREIEEKK